MRFAPIIRVSTEEQAQKGESLRVQKDSIINWVQQLGGTIPETCWKYSGQEHGTPEQERDKLNQLLDDSNKGLFDAVIVCDISRWSRDNYRSKEALKILRTNRIKFFVGTMEYDLFSPEHAFLLGVTVETSEFQVYLQKKKSFEARVSMAKRGENSAGRCPYGRTYNKDTKEWGIDEEKVDILNEIIERYLSGESGVELAKEKHQNWSNLLRVMQGSGGDTWNQVFDGRQFGMDVIEIPTTVPRILSDEMMETLKKRIEANQTYRHGMRGKENYLLSGMIFCDECGYAMAGSVNSCKNKTRYYRHSKNGICDKGVRYLLADEIEEAVFLRLLDTFKNTKAVEKAIQDAIPNIEELEKAKRDLDRCIKELTKNEQAKERIIDRIADGIITKDEARRKMEEARNKHSRLIARKITLEAKLVNLPSKKTIKMKAGLTSQIFKSYYSNPVMDWEDKRNVLQSVFDGTTPEGQRMGIYIKRSKDKLEYEIKGVLVNETHQLPMRESEKEGLIGTNYIRDFHNISHVLCLCGSF